MARVLAWQRLVPPWPIGDAVEVSAERLTDTCTVTTPRWWLKHPPCTIEQSAPAVVSRGLPLPVVTGPEPRPYVVASRHPGGAVSLAVLDRTETGSPAVGRAHVALSGLVPDAPLGVFGRVAELQIEYSTPPVAMARLMAQDLLDETAWDITGSVVRDGARVCVDGPLLDSLRSQQADNGSDGGGLPFCWRTPGG